MSIPERTPSALGPRTRGSTLGYGLAAWIVLGLALYGYWVVLIQSSNWFPALGQFLGWLRSPVIQGSWPHLPGWPAALLGTGLLLGVGGLVSLAMLPPGEFDHAPAKLLAYSALFGLAAAGSGVQVAAVTGYVYLSAVLIWVALVGLGAGVIARRRQGSLRAALRRARARRPAGDAPGWQTFIGRWILVVATTIGLLAALHAVAFPVTEWDAAIYHAGTAKIWFLQRPAPPVIAGPSVGIEMSYHYPSLFPGIGVYYYLLAGGPHDIYLRLLAPLFGSICLILVYFTAKRVHGRLAGYFAVLVLSVTPLFFLYEVFPTSYAPLMALLIALFDCVVGLWDTGKAEYLVTAAILAGLIGSLTYLSAFVYAFLIVCALAFIARRRIRARSVILAAVVIILIAGPVYLRNWMVLGDPVFPFGYKVFRSPYITDPSILRDSIAEIRNNALGYWLGYDERDLLRAQIRTMLWDKTLLPVGALAALAGGLLFPVRARPAAAIFAGWAMFVAATQLLAGSYWLRTLTLVLPVLAVLTGTTFAAIAQRVAWPDGRGTPLSAGIVPFLTRFAMYALLVAMSIFPGLTLAWAGPNQHTWTPFMAPTDDYARAWKHIGDDQGWIRHVYTGDYDAWRWLDDHLGGTDRVASLDNRWYYLRGYDAILYLDGREGAPLVAMDRPGGIIRYLRERGVRYILSPGWVEIGPARHPLAARLPLYRHLGSVSFPLVAAFPVHDADYYTRIYGVGPSPVDPEVRVLRAGEEEGGVRLRAGAEDGRIVVRMPSEGTYLLEIEYRDEGPEPIDLNYLRSVDWTDWKAFSSLPRTGSRSWIVKRFVLAGFRDVLVLGPYARGTDAVIRRVAVRRLPVGGDGLLPGDEVVLGGRARITLPLSRTFQPTSARITLQVPEGAEPKMLRAYAGGHPISLELWRGVIRERTAWWRWRAGAARAPALPAWGTSAPTLSWSATPGTYTLMIVPWGRGRPPGTAVLRIADAVMPKTDQ